MAINFNTQIFNNFFANVATDAAYQSPGTYGLPGISDGTPQTVGNVVVTGTNNAYTSAPTISFADGGSTGSAAAGTVRMKLATIAVNAAGTGYVPNEVLTLTYGTPVSTFTRSVVTVATTKVVTATIHAGGGGTGYGATQTFNATVVGGAGATAAVINVTSSAGGVVNVVNSITTAGSYTTNAPLSAAATTGGTGTGLTFDLVFGVNTLAAVTVPGQYTVVATTATQGATSGVGTGFTAQTMTFSVDSVLITNAGTNYTGTITGTFSAGNATAQVYAVQVSQQRLLTLIDIVYGYLTTCTSGEEMNEARDVLQRMVSKIRVSGGTTAALGGSGGGFSAATVATNARQAGVLRYAKRLRASF
jgi:hypothetical protein